MGRLYSLVHFLERPCGRCTLPKTHHTGRRKFGLGAGHLEGPSAVTIGFAMLGMAAGGIGWLLRLTRYRRILRLALFGLWLGTIVAYLSFASP